MRKSQIKPCTAVHMHNPAETCRLPIEGVVSPLQAVLELEASASVDILTVHGVQVGLGSDAELPAEKVPIGQAEQLVPPKPGRQTAADRHMGGGGGPRNGNVCLPAHKYPRRKNCPYTDTGIITPSTC